MAGKYFRRIPKGVYIVAMLFVLYSILNLYEFFCGGGIYFLNNAIKGDFARSIFIMQTVVSLCAGLGLLFLNRISWFFALFVGGLSFLLGCLTMIFLSPSVLRREILLGGGISVSDGGIVLGKIMMLLIMIVFLLLPMIYLYKVRHKFYE